MASGNIGCGTFVSGLIFFGLLYVATGAKFFLILTAFTAIGALIKGIIWMFSGPYHNPFDPF